MSPNQLPPESPRESGEADDAASPMERFKTLTRELLKVPYDQLKREQERYREGRPGRSEEGSLRDSKRTKK